MALKMQFMAVLPRKLDKIRVLVIKKQKIDKNSKKPFFW